MSGLSGPWPAAESADPSRERAIALALPVIPGQSEAYRRFVQELAGSRHAELVAACQRWGIAGLSLWLAPHKPGDIALARLALAADLGEVEARMAAASDPFDQWLKARLCDLHGVDLRYGVARYLVDLLGQWPEPTLTARINDGLQTPRP